MLPGTRSANLGRRCYLYTCRRTLTYGVCGAHHLLDGLYLVEQLRWTPIVERPLPCAAFSVDCSWWTASTLHSSLSGLHFLEGLYPTQLFPNFVQCTFTKLYRSKAMFSNLCMLARIRPLYVNNEYIVRETWGMLDPSIIRGTPNFNASPQWKQCVISPRHLMKLCA